MPHLIIYVLVAVLMLLSTQADAAEFEREVPIDLAKALVEIPSSGEVRFYDGPPESFPDFTLPTGFSIVGSMEIADVRILRLVLTSELEITQGLETLTESLQDDGYVLLPENPPVQRGFVSDRQTMPILSLCNDDKGELRVRGINRGETILYSMLGSSTTIDATGDTCRDRSRNRSEIIADSVQRRNSGIRSELPVMLVPFEEGSDSRAVITSSRSGGGDEYYETASQLHTSRSATFIHDDIANQLASQDWELVQALNELESNWRSIREDETLFGELVITEAGEGILNLYFRISENDGLYIDDGNVGQPRRGI